MYKMNYDVETRFQLVVWHSEPVRWMYRSCSLPIREERNWQTEFAEIARHTHTHDKNDDNLVYSLLRKKKMREKK